ncbi:MULTISPECIES: carbamoyl phosphate synthase small subunit [Fusobacterium]|uniref:carbamoyl phosphate synthase small subunit n=1 Tax=Fusobacterium TaxID=848 RepID=UPI001030E460|nr:carbamoyl phosphate synthase small subunit [Fusobacterium ulcerans]
MKGKLILENGMSFDGKIFGHFGETTGEIVFTTGMTGYQEILTDPSFYGKIVVMTYPMVGNYGLNLEDMESDKIHLKGFIIKEDAKLPNNFRCEMTLEGFLSQYNVVGFKGVDTRELTKIIRDNGSMKAIITDKELTHKELKERFDNFSYENAVEQVSRKGIIEIGGNGLKIGVLDLGVKRSTLDTLEKMGFAVSVFPYDTSSDELLKHKLDGLIISSGPGNPNEMDRIVRAVRGTLANIPMLGISLGAQIINLALGGKVAKMNNGHRGVNHPVEDLKRDKIYITSQNHGYSIEKLGISSEATHFNLNDKTVEGFRCDDLAAMGVQFMPDFYPEDSNNVFADFLSLIEKGVNLEGIEYCDMDEEFEN